MRDNGVNCPTSRAMSITTNGLPTRAATSAASGVGAEALHAFEQMQAPFDLQDQAIRRDEAYARRKALRANGEPLQPVTARGRFAQMDTDPQLGRDNGRRAGKAPQCAGL
jgi:hypothetical protein